MTTTGRIGGAERLIVDVVRAAKNEGHCDPQVAVLTDAGDLRHEFSGSGVPVRSLGIERALQAPLAIARLTRLIARERFDVVHTHLIHASAIGLLAGKLARVPVAVMTRHYERYVWLYGDAVERVLHRSAHRLADRIFAVSEAARAVLVDVEGIPSQRISVVPNGVDFERVRRMSRQPSERPRSPSTHFTIATVGSLHPRKGHAYLIEAVARLHDRAKVALVIVGDGYLSQELHRLARDLGLGAQVFFVGYDASPYAALAACDLYVQPSVEEGFGIAVVEAMALERPVVATRVGGLPEIVEHDVSGLLVKAADPDQLAAAVQRCIDDPSLRARLASAGRRSAEERFGAAAVSARYAAEYRDLLART